MVSQNKLGRFLLRQLRRVEILQQQSDCIKWFRQAKNNEKVGCIIGMGLRKSMVQSIIGLFADGNVAMNCMTAISGMRS